MSRLSGEIILPGEASGPLLRLTAPISFWGGVDPATGSITDPRHPEHGRAIGGTVLAIERTIGSSSSSAIMLELLRNGQAPAALLLGAVDAILSLGVVVGREMDYPAIPVVALGQAVIASLPLEGQATIAPDGTVRISPA